MNWKTPEQMGGFRAPEPMGRYDGPLPSSPAVAPPWATPPQPQAAFANPQATIDPLLAKFGHLDRDAALMAWNDKKAALEEIKAQEMELRKYIVLRAFPAADEGTNRVELGNGYDLKAVVKYNYGFGEATNDEIEETLDAIHAVGNIGPVIAERLVTWTAAFKLTEYRRLEEAEATGNITADESKIKKLIDGILVKSDAAPTLEITNAKKKK